MNYAIASQQPITELKEMAKGTPRLFLGPGPNPSLNYVYRIWVEGPRRPLAPEGNPIHETDLVVRMLLDDYGDTTEGVPAYNYEPENNPPAPPGVTNPWTASPVPQVEPILPPEPPPSKDAGGKAVAGLAVLAGVMLAVWGASGR